MARQSPYHLIRSRLFEIIAVFLGVALAFFADDWRESRAQRREEQTLLLSLRDEVLLNRTQMDHRLDLNLRARESVRALMSQLDSEEIDGALVPVPDSLLVAFVTNATYDPARGGIDAILAGGQLPLIRDAELRAQLAAWPAEFENVNSLQLLQRNLVHNLFGPTLARVGVNLSPHWPANTTFFLGDTLGSMRSTVTSVPATAEVKALVGQRFQVVRLVYSNLLRLSDWDTQLLEQLNAQLESY